MVMPVRSERGTGNYSKQQCDKDPLLHGTNLARELPVCLKSPALMHHKINAFVPHLQIARSVNCREDDQFFPFARDQPPTLLF